MSSPPGPRRSCPLLVTCDLPAYERNLPLIAGVLDRDEFRGRLLGIHLEGPFISAELGAVGAHNLAQPALPPAGLTALAMGHPPEVRYV